MRAGRSSAGGSRSRASADRDFADAPFSRLATFSAAALRRLYRLPLLVAMLFAGLAIVFAIFPFTGRPAHERLIRDWSRLLMRCTGVRVSERVAPGARALGGREGGAMLLANHVSWLDIFAINSVAAAVFVAKAEIARWPLAGTLVARVGTVFIERSRRHAVHSVIHALAERMQAGQLAAVFPEGTTSDGERLLPFYGNLAQAGISAGVTIVPVGLRYRGLDGEPAQAAHFVGDTSFLESVWRVTGAPGLIAEIHVLPDIDPDGTLRRHEIARAAREAISRRLGLDLEDTVPERLRGRRA